MSIITLAQPRTLNFTRRRSLIGRVPMAVWNSALLLIAVVLGALYLVQVNKTMSYGYEIRETEKQVNEIRTTSRANAIKLSERETVGTLTTQAAALGMVPVNEVEYVTTSSAGVALR